MRTAGLHRPRVLRVCCEASASDVERPARPRRSRRAKKPDLAELSEKSAALLEQTHVPFHSLTGSADEKDSEPVRLLDQAETELADYCKNLPEGASTDRCWQAYNIFESKKREAEGSCSLEESSGVAGGSGCMSLERLEDFVRQMVGQAPTRLFVQTLLVLDRAEHQSAEAKAKIVDKVAAASEAAERAEDPEVARRERLTALFYALDTDLSGTLDVGEFRDAMRRFGSELDGRAAGKVLDTLDIHGSISLEHFLTIAEARLPTLRGGRIGRPPHPPEAPGGSMSGSGGGVSIGGPGRQTEDAEGRVGLAQSLTPAARAARQAEELVAKTQLATWLRSRAYVEQLPNHLDSLL